MTNLCHRIVVDYLIPLFVAQRVSRANRRSETFGAGENARAGAAAKIIRAGKSRRRSGDLRQHGCFCHEAAHRRFYEALSGNKAVSVHFSGAAIITRLESEARAGKPLSDVVLSGQLGVSALIDKKIALRYRSPEREFFRAGLKDQDGLWTAYMTNVMVSAFNTRQVKKDEAPRNVERSIEPALEGQADHGQPVLRLVRHHAAISR